MIFASGCVPFEGRFGPRSGITPRSKTGIQGRLKSGLHDYLMVWCLLQRRRFYIFEAWWALGALDIWATQTESISTKSSSGLTMAPAPQEGSYWHLLPASSQNIGFTKLIGGLAVEIRYWDFAPLPWYHYNQKKICADWRLSFHYCSLMVTGLFPLPPLYKHF